MRIVYGWYILLLFILNDILKTHKNVNINILLLLLFLLYFNLADLIVDAQIAHEKIIKYIITEIGKYLRYNV